METNKLIGIISASIVMAIYFANTALTVIFGQYVEFLGFYYKSSRFLFFLSLLVFYYSIIVILKKHDFKTEVNLFLGVIIVEILRFLMQSLHVYFGLSVRITVLFRFIPLILFILIAIRLFAKTAEHLLDIKQLKNFVIAMIAVFGFFLLIPLPSGLYRFTNFFHLLNAIPYVFGLMFFLKSKTNDTLNPKDIN